MQLEGTHCSQQCVPLQRYVCRRCRSDPRARGISGYRHAETSPIRFADMVILNKTAVQRLSL